MSTMNGHQREGDDGVAVDESAVEQAVLRIAEHLTSAFDLPTWNVVRQGGTQGGRWSGPYLRSGKYVGKEGSTPGDFSREVAGAFSSAHAAVTTDPGTRRGGWLLGAASVGGASITVRSKGSIEIVVQPDHG